MSGVCPSWHWRFRRRAAGRAPTSTSPRAMTTSTKSLLNEAIVEYRRGGPGRRHARRRPAEARRGLREEWRPGRRDARVRARGRSAAGQRDRAGQSRQLLLLARAFEDAQARAKKALELEPQNVDALVLMGNALAGLKDLDGAIAEYQEALALNPGEEAAYANIGAIQFARGQKAEAEATFRKAVDAAPKSVNARLGARQFSLGHRHGAKEAEQTLQGRAGARPGERRREPRARRVLHVDRPRPRKPSRTSRPSPRRRRPPTPRSSLADYYIAMSRLDEAKTVLGDLAKKPEAFAPATTRLAAIEAAQTNRPRAHELRAGRCSRSSRSSFPRGC